MGEKRYRRQIRDLRAWTRRKVWKEGRCGVCLRDKVRCGACRELYCRLDMKAHKAECEVTQ